MSCWPCKPAWPSGVGAASDGLQVVAWSQREVEGRSQWLRWQSAVLRTQGELSRAWQQAALWGSNPGAAKKRSEVAITPLQQWQLFYFRSDAWSNPMSSGNPEADQGLPDGVRLVLSLPSGQALSGTLSSDWVRPTVGARKS